MSSQKVKWAMSPIHRSAVAVMLKTLPSFPAHVSTELKTVKEVKVEARVLISYW